MVWFKFVKITKETSIMSIMNYYISTPLDPYLYDYQLNHLARYGLRMIYAFLVVKRKKKATLEVNER